MRKGYNFLSPSSSFPFFLPPSARPLVNGNLNGQPSGKYKTLDKYLEHPKSRY